MFRFARLASGFASVVVILALCGQSVSSQMVYAAQPVSQSNASKPVFNRPIKDKWALVIGISKFADGKINLRFPAKDATDFYNFLTTDAGFRKDHTKLLVNENATRANILATIGDRWLPRLAHPDDLVVVYISSHGSPADMDVGGVNYIVAYDTDTESLYATGIPLQDLMRIIKARVHCDRVVMILDACHSGAASADAKGLVRSANVDASAVVAGTGQLVIASSQPSQVSWESRKYQNSVFTSCLIEALKQNSGRTTLGAAFQNMKDRVEDEVLRDRGQLQTPEMKSHWDGSALCLSTPPTAPRAGLEANLEESLRLGTAKDSVFDLQGKPLVKDAAAKPLTKVNLPKTILNNGNIDCVFNKPQQPTTFDIDVASSVIYLMTYHWNDGKGSLPGTLTLRHSDGSTYGPWAVRGQPGQGGVPNAYWECEPRVTLLPGHYTLVDSDVSTWSQNNLSGNCGIAKVKIVPEATKTMASFKAYRRQPIASIFKNGNIAAVFNSPTRPTWFVLRAPVLVSRLMNYHWNDGRGQDPGEIGFVHQDGTAYGPWSTHTAPGQGGVPNAYWICEPDTVLKPGIYMVTDSDGKTWSQNAETKGAGITEIDGVVQD